MSSKFRDGTVGASAAPDALIRMVIDEFRAMIPESERNEWEERLGVEFRETLYARLSPIMDETLMKNSGLTEPELDFFNSIARGAGQTVQFETDNIDRSEQRIPDSVRVAALSFLLPEFESPVVHQAQPCYYHQELYRARKRYFSYAEWKTACRVGKRILKTIRELLTESRHASKPVHFVVLNELAISVSFWPRKWLFHKLRKMANEFDVVIVAGTYNHEKYYYNACPIFVPSPIDNTRDDSSKRKLKWLPYQIYKQNVADKQEESIGTPDGRSVRFVKTRFGTICVMICLDSYDPGLVLKLIHKSIKGGYNGGTPGNQQGKLHLILIPSANKDEPAHLRKKTKTLSRMTGCAVVTPNSWPNQGGHDMASDPGYSQPRIEAWAYLAGEEITGEQWRSTGEINCRIYEFGREKLRDPRTGNYDRSTDFRTILGEGGFSVSTTHGQRLL